jgi:hypothetical protein
MLFSVKPSVLLCVLEQPREDDFSTGPNAVLCKTCSVLLYGLEQPREDNFSAGPNGVLCKTFRVLLCVLEHPREDNFSAGPNAVLFKMCSVLLNTLHILQRTALGPALKLSSLGCSSTHNNTL